MRIFVKPKPNEKFFKLTYREAAHYAMGVAKKYGDDGTPDWKLYKEWTDAHKVRNRAGRQLSLA